MIARSFYKACPKEGRESKIKDFDSKSEIHQPQELMINLHREKLRSIVYSTQDIILTETTDDNCNTERTLNFLLNSLYAVDLIADVCLLEIISICCTRKKSL